MPAGASDAADPCAPADRWAALRSAYLRAVNQLLLVTQPGIVFAIATADIFIPILLGEKWRAAAPIFQWMGLAALAAADQRHDELAVHQSRAKQGFCLVGGVQCRDQRGRVLRRVALGTDWRCGRLFRYTGSDCGRPVAFWMATRTGPVGLRGSL